MGCRKSERDEQRKVSRVRLNPDSVWRSICHKSPIFRERALYFRTRDVEERESCTSCARFLWRCVCQKAPIPRESALCVHQRAKSERDEQREVSYVRCVCQKSPIFFGKEPCISAKESSY